MTETHKRFQPTQQPCPDPPPQLRAFVSESPRHRLTLRVALNLVWWQIDCVSKVSADLALPVLAKGHPTAGNEVPRQRAGTGYRPTEPHTLL